MRVEVSESGTGGGAHDYAIVVGVATPTRAVHAIERAYAFRDWLVAVDGGGLPADQAAMIVSGPQGNQSTLTSLSDGASGPVRATVKEWFDGLALPSVRRGGPYTGRAGRRLYVYFNGPAAETTPSEYVLLARGQSQLVPSIWINGFVKSVCDAGLFEEVVAFADLSVESVDSPRRGTLEPRGPQKLERSLLAPTKLLLGFSVTPDSRLPAPRPGPTRGAPSRRSSEGEWGEAGPPSPALAKVPPPPPTTRNSLESMGEFSNAGDTRDAGFTERIIAGLRGEARDADGNVTARSLIRYVTVPDNLNDPLPVGRPWFEVREPESIVLVSAVAGAAPSVTEPATPDDTRGSRVWLLSPADSDLVLTRDIGSDMPKRPRSMWLTTEFAVGEAVFLQSFDGESIVGVTRVRKLREPTILPSNAPGRGHHVSFDEVTLFERALDVAERGDPVRQFVRRAAEATIKLDAHTALTLCGIAVALNPSLIEVLEDGYPWEGNLASIAVEATLSAVAPVSIADLPRSLLERLSTAQIQNILENVRAIDEPQRRLRTLRRLAATVRRVFPGRAHILSVLRDDADPEARALAVPPPPARQNTIFGYSCFIDSTTIGDRRVADVVGTLAARVSSAVQAARGEPVWFFIGGPDDPDWLERALKALPESACVVLPYTERATHRSSWQFLVRRAAEIDEKDRAEFRERGVEGFPGLVLTVALDSATASNPPGRNETIDATALFEDPTDEMWAGIVERIVDAIVRRCVALDTLARARIDTPRPRLSRTEALGRIDFVTGDLLEYATDAIVNPVGINPRLTGELGDQIYERVGRDLYRGAEFEQTLVTGETIVMPTYDRIRARFVVHTCTDSSATAKTAQTIAAAAVGAIEAADRTPDVQTIALPSLGTGAAAGSATSIAEAVLPRVVERLQAGTRLQRVTFVFRDERILAAYQSVLERLRSATTTAATAAPSTIAGRTLYLSARPSIPGTVVVGGAVPVTLSLGTQALPNATALLVPLSALELTIYVDAPGFHVDGVNASTVSLIEGEPDRASITTTLTAVAPGRHEVTFSVHARDGGAGGHGVVSVAANVTAFVEVDSTVVLPDIPELIDRRTIPNPQPDVMLYVALERLPEGEQVRIHATCRALGLDRRRFDEPLRLTRADVRAIRQAAARAAATSDGGSPADSDRAMKAFGGVLFDLLMPNGHPLRALVREIARANDPANPMSWLVIADDDVGLPWDLVCPHGYDANGHHWYGEFLSRQFVFGYWIGRKGFTLAEEAPVGLLGLVHYGQRPEKLAAFQSALGESMVGIADPRQSLDIMGADSPFFGVHLLRYPDTGRARIVEASETNDAATDWRAGSAAVVRDRRLDFTLRRPIVALSFVDDALDTRRTPAERDTQLEQAWTMPLLMARVSAVVGPRWTTLPAADRAFYGAFYAAVRQGVPLGAAVLEARAVVRAAYPDRSDWLAYAYFGHPQCAPYEVEPADGFTLFEPLGMTGDETFEAGRTYRFRASYRGELPAWYGGRRRVRHAPLDGTGVSVLVAPLMGGSPMSFDLRPVHADSREGDDYQRIVELTMPDEETEMPVLVQFTRDTRELQSSIVRLDVRKADV